MSEAVNSAVPVTLKPSQNQSKAASVARKAGIISFAFVMYSYTTAGPFGLEDQVTTSGPG